MPHLTPSFVGKSRQVGKRATQTLREMRRSASSQFALEEPLPACPLNKFARRKRVSDRYIMTANAAAEHLAQALKLSGYVIMKRPPLSAHSAPPAPHAHLRKSVSPRIFTNPKVQEARATRLTGCRHFARRNQHGSVCEILLGVGCIPYQLAQ